MPNKLTEYHCIYLIIIRIKIIVQALKKEIEKGMVGHLNQAFNHLIIIYVIPITAQFVEIIANVELATGCQWPMGLKNI